MTHVESIYVRPVTSDLCMESKKLRKISTRIVYLHKLRRFGDGGGSRRKGGGGQQQSGGKYQKWWISGWHRWIWTCRILASSWSIVVVRIFRTETESGWEIIIAVPSRRSVYLVLNERNIRNKCRQRRIRHDSPDHCRLVQSSKGTGKCLARWFHSFAHSSGTSCRILATYRSFITTNCFLINGCVRLINSDGH